MERKLKLRKKPNSYVDLPTLDHPFYYLLADRFNSLDSIPFCLAVAFTF